MLPAKRFKWVDRETTARDLVQLACHAPQRISERALRLLSVFPSSTIASELIGIALDTNRRWLAREESLTVLVYIKEGLYAPELAPMLQEDFVLQQQYLPHYANATEDRRHYDFGLFWGGLLYTFVMGHPENLQWFCEALNSIADPFYVYDLLWESNDVAENPTLVKWFVDFLNSRPETFSQQIVDAATLHLKEMASFRIEQAKVSDDDQNVEETDTQPHLIEDSPCVSSPIWQEFTALYFSALDGDYDAYSRIRDIAGGWAAYLPLTAIAIYFLGKLQSQYDSLDLLCNLINHSRDNWYYGQSGYDAWHPVREEALRALWCNGSAQAWEAIIDGFFVNPADEMNWMFYAAIEDLTEKLTVNLNGPQLQDKGHSKRENLFKERRPWFKVLCKMDQPLDYYLHNWGIWKVG